MVRVTGIVEKIQPREKGIKQMFEENPIIYNVYPDNTQEILDPFCIKEGEIEYMI